MTEPKKSNGYNAGAFTDYYDQVDEEGRLTIGGLLSDLGVSAHIIAIAKKHA